MSKSNSLLPWHWSVSVQDCIWKHFKESYCEGPWKVHRQPKENSNATIKSLLQMESVFFFFLVVEGRRRQGKKGSNILVSVQCCCHTRKPNKNNRRKLSVKGNLQTTSKINKLKEEKKKRNFPLCSWPREVPFKGLLILCYSMCSSWFTRP